MAEPLDIAQLEASMRRLQVQDVSLAVWANGSAKIVRRDEDVQALLKDGAVLYSPEDMFRYVQLEEKERALLREFKQRHGGTVEWKEPA